MHDSRAMCQETVSWALIVRKMLQLQGDNVTLYFHNFQAIISCPTSRSINMKFLTEKYSP